MSVSRLLVRFALLYVGLLVLTVIVVSVFDLKKPSSFNAILLIVSTMWVCSKYAERNGRALEGAAKTAAVLGMLAIDMIVQAIGVALVDVSKSPGTSITPLLLAFVTIAVLHLIAIYVGVWAGARHFVKHAEKSRAAPGRRRYS